MPTRRGILLALCAALLLTGGLAFVARERVGRCAAVPLLAEALLPAPDFGRLEPAPSGVLLPAGWSAPAVGVQVGEFTVSGGSSFQLLGIANSLQTPSVAVQPGGAYCISAQALADSPVSETRLRAEFHWLDASGAALARDSTAWQQVRQWAGPADRGGWSPISGAFEAPPGAARLAVSFHPASDDRVYLDQIVIRSGGLAQPRDGRSLANGQPPPSLVLGPSSSISVAPWPEGRRAAVSFSFDWETAMGGLVHSRSVNDPNFDQDPVLRGMRMRDGVTTTLAIFRPYDVRATYYANGYNFLPGNRDRRTFIGDPTFTWATPANRWKTDVWARTPWFASDPYGTTESDPAWYFGDLLPLLVAADHDVQSHTFSHLYAGLASVDELRADLREWNMVAAERGLPPARSLAFPWSGSAGMSYAAWQALADAGITSVTRTSEQAQYRFVSAEEPHCRPVPGHEQILACPDFYLTERSAQEAQRAIDRAIDAGGMIDLWAHTEEVVTPGQIAAWSEVVGYAAARRDSGEVWIAPLREITDWQQALSQVRLTANDQRATIQNGTLDEGAVVFVVTNRGPKNLDGLTLALPFAVGRATVDGAESGSRLARERSLTLDIEAGQAVEVVLWPA